MRSALVALLALLAFLGCATQAQAKNFAVVVAGSDNYGNYRHQADIGHALSILLKGGLAREDIIVLAADDIAQNRQNPFPGQIFNKPSDGPGQDYYATPDYKGQQVTAANFLAALSGNATATGGLPVLKTGPEDNIFVFYSDHGSPGLVAMPFGPVLTVNQLKDTLIGMKADGKFKNLVFYLEACESGSMFEGWLDSTIVPGLYATTAANGVESSWGFYCGSDAKINGKNIGSCLGDEYSITWMESVDELGYGQSLQSNYEYVKAAVKGSHVQQFGDPAVAKMTMDQFLTSGKANQQLPKPTPKTVQEALATATAKRIDSRDMAMHYLFDKYTDKDASAEAKFEDGLLLVKELQSRLSADMRFRQLAVSILGQQNGADATLAAPKRPAVECGRCCEEAYAFLSEEGACKFTDYSLKYGRTIVNVCMDNVRQGEDRTAAVMSKLQSLCSKNYF